jgi:hypothetical protein
MGLVGSQGTKERALVVKPIGGPWPKPLASVGAHRDERHPLFTLSRSPAQLRAAALQEAADGEVGL